MRAPVKGCGKALGCLGGRSPAGDGSVGCQGGGRGRPEGSRKGTGRGLPGIEAHHRWKPPEPPASSTLPTPLDSAACGPVACGPVPIRFYNKSLPEAKMNTFKLKTIAVVIFFALVCVVGVLVNERSVLRRQMVFEMDHVLTQYRFQYTLALGCACTNCDRGRSCDVYWSNQIVRVPIVCYSIMSMEPDSARMKRQNDIFFRDNAFR